MIIKNSYLYILLFILLLTNCSKNDIEKENSTETRQYKKVLIIGIDGCLPEAIKVAKTPSLDKLMDNGTFSLDALNIKTTMSGPAWSSIFTGVWEEKHGVTNNSFEGSNFSAYPHFFKYIKKPTLIAEPFR